MNIQNETCSAPLFNPAGLFSNPNFPQVLMLDDDEAFTYSSFRDNIISAQKAGLPYYLVSVAELESKVYKIYDTLYLRAFIYESAERVGDLINSTIDLPTHSDFFVVDPLTRLPIEKVHYFCISCFDDNFEPVVLPDLVPLSLHNYFDPKVYDCDQLDENSAIDALDYYTLLKNNASEEDINTIKISQELVMSECLRTYQVIAAYAKTLPCFCPFNSLLNSSDSSSGISFVTQSSFCSTEIDSVFSELSFCEDLSDMAFSGEFTHFLTSSGGHLDWASPFGKLSSIDLFDYDEEIFEEKIIEEFEYNESEEAILKSNEIDEVNADFLLIFNSCIPVERADLFQSISEMRLRFLKWHSAWKYDIKPQDKQ
ncbi:MAG: hypothetical protein H0W50_05310 [Parachlamydiaceae bacterium]|nr:hypothetical protein [Parachlamydiaceae bacterium]